MKTSVRAGTLLLLFCLSAPLMLCACRSKESVVTLDFGSFAGSAWRIPNPDTYILYDEIIRLFEEKHPDIRVVYKSGILRDDYSEWLSSAILKESEPDCFFILPEDFHLLADIGLLFPLDSFLSRSKEIQNAYFFESAMLAGRQNNVQYAVPVESDPTLLFVNTSLLEREGIDFPSQNWTWDEFLSICQKVTKDTDGDGVIDQFGVQGFDWITALYTNRAPLFDYSGRQGLFDSEEVFQSFEFLQKLQAVSHDQKIPDFESGTVAFKVSSYSWYRSYGYYPYSILKSGKYKWKAIVLPRGPNGKNAADLKTLFLGISARSRHKKEALLFLEFILTDEKVQTMFMDKSKGIPARKDFMNRDVVSNILLKDITLAGNEISTDTIVRSIDDAMIIPNFRRYSSAVSFIGKDIARIPGGTDQLKLFLSQLNINVNKFLSQ
jgi:multiple sugar transport system substrate-binding protein